MLHVPTTKLLTISIKISAKMKEEQQSFMSQNILFINCCDIISYTLFFILLTTVSILFYSLLL